ncbi:tail fiber domain-containing protein [Akkermansiaceae bacterium]|nr:tail fiber domain-containing protein [Akkermansiaceae bacterium]
MSKQTDLINIPDAITVSGSNLGIGTSSPAYKLDVNGSLSSNGNENVMRIAAADATNAGGVTINSIYGATASARVTTLFSIDGQNQASPLAFGTGSTESMRIDSSGNVGIGTTSPSSYYANHLVVDTGSSVQSGITIVSDTGNQGMFAFADGTSGDTRYRGAIDYNHSNDSMAFLSSSAERMRIDASGNFLVGQTSANATNVGFSVRHQGTVVNTVSGADALELRRHSSAGSIINFRYGNSTIGSIGVVPNNITIGSNDTGFAFLTANDAIVPWNMSSQNYRDNVIDLGVSSVRFDDIYATNGTIQTSDFNEKQDIASLTATEMLVGKRISALFKTFRWKDSVAENGDNARTHAGVIAQDVQAAFTEEGLDAGDYALFISSTWWEHDIDVPAVEAVAEVLDEDGNVTTEAVEAVDAYTRTDNYDTEAEAPEGATSKTRMGIRYPELLSFVAAYNEQRFASIEARLTALEA